jgi:hypothetical protein
MEFVVAGVGVVLALWMILGARRRHRSNPHEQRDPDA